MSPIKGRCGFFVKHYTCRQSKNVGNEKEQSKKRKRGALLHVGLFVTAVHACIKSFVFFIIGFAEQTAGYLNSTNLYTVAELIPCKAHIERKKLWHSD